MPPWRRSVAGAPKKSKRGAHLVGAGNEISVKGHQGKKRQNIDEGAGQGGVVSGGVGAPAFDVAGEHMGGGDDGRGRAVPRGSGVSAGASSRLPGQAAVVGRSVIPGVNDFSSEDGEVVCAPPRHGPGGNRPHADARQVGAAGGLEPAQGRRRGGTRILGSEGSYTTACLSQAQTWSRPIWRFHSLTRTFLRFLRL